MEYNAGEYDIAVVGAGQGAPHGGARQVARSSILWNKILAQGGIKFRRASEKKTGSRVSRKFKL